MNSNADRSSPPEVLVFVGGTAILPDRLLADAVVICRDGWIESIGQSQPIPEASQVVDLGGNYLSPGFVDLHVHGGDGADFMDGDEEAVRTAATAHLRGGTTTLLPTSTTGSPQRIHRMIDACESISRESSEQFTATSPQDRSAVLPHVPGIHLYGPFFADGKTGCHDRDARRDPEPDEYRSYFDRDFVRVATCAAELPGAESFYRLAAAHECLITCGHSNSSWTEMQAAFDAGMRHVDHFWCAMSSVPSLRARFQVPMQASMTEFVLMNEEMSTEVIADGCHLAPELLEFAYRMKGPERLCLVTDANRAYGMPPGEYVFGHRESGCHFFSDANVGWTLDRTSLASSVQGMHHMVSHFAKVTSATLPDVIRMASLTPAQRVGIDAQTGSLTAGKRADLLVLDAGLQIQQIYVQGRQV
ncbi:amidohydrolase family protein [Allorhodopirellula solitaria]|uniref:N-acetylglucosamine-6-phosphate deacetylase n=1 Tax=Allorhodopirellula solitaria TaxID=2527987 RepID=A0A5C5XTD3_9BACT|nr:amidohydrolase family protein [Allorhodopirellula solitaria]TWT66170.1 N-acetylglucosamine-6-phosphate deacetylase [Allorhodopirellula solitaria]